MDKQARAEAIKEYIRRLDNYKREYANGYLSYRLGMLESPPPPRFGLHSVRMEIDAILGPGYRTISSPPIN